MIIEFHDLKYSLSAFTVMALLVFIGFLPWVNSWLRKRPTLHSGAIEATCIAVIISVIFLAITGFILSLTPPHSRHAIALTIIISVLLLGGFKATKSFRGREITCSPLESVTIGGFLLFGAAVLIITSINFPMKDSLPDGAYVNKEQVSSVKIQSIVGHFPADNVVPFVVEEYMAKNISFKENSTILPGQNVANRPILVSLVTLPIRLAFKSPKPLGNLPTYEYVSIQWPDFRILMRDEAAFSIFLGVGVFLNACLFLGIGLMATKVQQINFRTAALLLLLFATSPYFIFQTMFTWPKSLAGFFIITAIFVYQKYKSGFIAGLLLALAYLSHPYAISYVIVTSGIFLIVDKSEDLYKRFAKVSIMGLSFLFFVSPWFIWVKLFVGGASDLIAQNFTLSGVTVFGFLWPRVANLMNTIVPTHLLSFDAHMTYLYASSALNLFGAVGSLLLVLAASVVGGSAIARKSALSNNSSYHTPEDVKQALWICATASLILTAVFSNPTVPVVHGWQPFAALLLLFGVYWANTSKIALCLCWLQVFINIAMGTIYFYRRFLTAD